MNNKILRQAETYRKSHTKKLWLYRGLSVIAAVAVFCTTYALILPAITMEKDPTCGIPEHTHTDECYAEKTGEMQFSCMGDLHSHSESCYDADGNLICGYADYAVHTHSEICYSESGELICPLPEIKAHTHSDSCLGTVRGELICTESESEGHSHTDDCLGVISKTLNCDIEETEAHVHTEECFETVITDKLICTPSEDEAEEHIHTDECYKTVKNCICTLETEGHTHTDECYTIVTGFVCGLEESGGHTHSDLCYESLTDYICGLTEGEGHVHTDECYEWNSVLSCTEVEEEVTDAEEPEETTERTAICGCEEIILHTHTEECYNEEGALVCGKLQITEHIHTADCLTESAPEVICGMTEHSHDEILCYIDETADTESSGDWEKTLPAELSGIWTSDLVSVASSQVGYTESKTNIQVDANGSISHYSRYGAWYGRPYGSWDQTFISFCLSYAGIPSSAVPQTSDFSSFLSEASQNGIVMSGDHVPQSGDIVLFSGNSGSGTGIVTSGGSTVSVIAGNYNGKVASLEIDASDISACVSVSKAAELYGSGDSKTNEDANEVTISVDSRKIDDKLLIILTAEFAENFDSSAYTWQWQSSEDGTADWNDIDSANNAEYSFVSDGENIKIFYRICGTKEENDPSSPLFGIYSMISDKLGLPGYNTLEEDENDEDDGNGADQIISLAVTPIADPGIAGAEADSTIKVGDYNVSLVLSGGKYNSDYAKSNGNVLESLGTPTLDNYIFSGWYYDAAYDSLVSFPVTLNQNTVFYAKWTEQENNKYYISFLNEKGTVVHVTGVYEADDTVYEVNEFTHSSLSIKGKKIEGWYTAPNRGGEKFNFGKTAEESIGEKRVLSLYAHYESAFTVTFVSNGGYAIPSQLVFEGNTATEPDANATTRTGYKFLGWSTDKDEFDKFNFNEPINENIVLYAFWESENVKVTLVYMFENADDDDYSPAGIEDTIVYAPAGSEITVTPESSVNLTTKHPVMYTVNGESKQAFTAENSNGTATVDEVKEKYFDFDHSDTKTVKGDGSTVIQVYYKRIRVTLTFNSNGHNITFNGVDEIMNNTELKNKFSIEYTPNSPGFIYSITAKYGQNIEEVYPQTSKITTNADESGKTFCGWTKPENGIYQTTLVSRMVEDLFIGNVNEYDNAVKFDANKNLTVSWTMTAEFRIMYNLYAAYAFTTLDGETPDFEYNGKKYTIGYIDVTKSSGTWFQYKAIDNCETALPCDYPSNYQVFVCNSEYNANYHNNTRIQSKKIKSYNGNPQPSSDGDCYLRGYENQTILEIFNKHLNVTVTTNDNLQILLYDRNKVKLTLNLMNGSNSTQTHDYLYGDKIYNDNDDILLIADKEIESGNIKKDGYRFAGWYTSSECIDGTQFVPSESSVIEGNMTLYAKWEPTQYTAKFYLYRDRTEPYRTEGFAEGDTLTQYSYSATNFDGWTWVGDETGSAFNFDSIVGQNYVDANGEMIFYAIWNKEHCVVVYDPGTGYSGSENLRYQDTTEYVINDSRVQLEDPTQIKSWTGKVPSDKDLVFVGWRAPNGRIYQSGRFIQITRPLMEFIAQWAKEDDVVKLIYDGNNATSGENVTETWAKNSEVTVWDNYDEKVNGTTIAKTKHFTRDGYEFTGWNTKSDGTGTAYAPGSQITLNATTTLYAQWRPSTYTLVIEKYYKAASNDGKTYLAGATFELKQGATTVKTVTTDADGKITITNELQRNTRYTLVETSAPNGFLRLTSPIYFELDSEGNVYFYESGEENAEKHSGSYGAAAGIYVTDTRILTVSVENKTGSELPHTGGMGTSLYTSVGLLIVGAAVILFMYNILGKKRCR